METCKKFLFLAFATFSIIHFVQSQNQQGFISIDCGLASSESSYVEPVTNITYISDAGFIRGGKTGTIKKDLETDFITKPYRVLRYFPDGTRNCYSLSVTQDTNYLIRAVFVYGNYDGLNIFPRFDLYLGPNLWKTLDLRTTDFGSAVEEIIYVTRSKVLDICLVKTGTSAPFISTIELRPLPYNTYTSQTGSLKNLVRYYFTNSNNTKLHRKDVHDRIWTPYFQPDWTHIDTTLNVTDSSGGYDLPQDVIRTAAIPTNDREPLIFSWSLESSDDETYAYIYVADIQQVRSNETREIEIVANGKVIFSPIRPKKFEVEMLTNTVPLKCEGGVCRVQLSKTPRSTLPPLMNALEIFTAIDFPQSETNQTDVSAIKKIDSAYGLNKLSWQGDPCVPKQFSWIGVRCSVTDVSTPPRIIALDLSGSGLNGVIAHGIQDLTQLQELDLSNNNLTGEVPEFLAKMNSLLKILEGNKDLCVSCHSKFPLVVVTASVSSLVAIIIIVLVIIFVLKRRKTSSGKVMRPSLEMKNRRFTYSEVREMTDNFQVVLGKGGFGVVCRGFLNNEQVAVKVISHSSTQGYKEFKTEVELLLRVHHVNLVSLVGYCDEGNDLALIYEFMENGNLKEHLSGIEYLHIGCKPPMIHRDVKSTNILLGRHFEAKLSDFGLSRSFLVGSQTHVSTNVAGTLGYLDPEYYQKNWLTEKSDVYSFGIVLLEIITGQPAIEYSRENSYLSEWATSMLANGDIEGIMDPNLQGKYDTGSSWKALELAMSCINPSSRERPNMTRVAHELNECLEIYDNFSKRNSQDANSSKSMVHNVSFISDSPSAR
ncbi:hypothetical protein CARUB_v10011370mg [Capsella rubella]|uniref:Protein kinase domain-containing protein n=1 Tax=Capsella rubella TaxID=81985 RepID=R0IP71_9BRAS|nr:hypothetical protein CARUB_v10011370mg [Capsella rubella]